MDSGLPNVIDIAYDKIPGLGALQTFGATVLGLALAVYMVVELYKLLVSGRCDFITPIVKIGGALLLLWSLVPIGTFLSSSLQRASVSLLNTNVFVLASDAWAAAFEGVSGPLDFVSNLFSQVTWLSLLTWLCLVGVIVIKLVVLDVLFPIMLGLVVITGSLSIPIGVFPGSHGLRGWVQNVVEISIWPLVFQILATLLFAAFSTQLADINTESMTSLRGLYNESEPDNWMEEKALEASPELKARVEKLQDEVFFKFVKFLAIAVTFGLLCLFTPLIARMVVRSESAGVVGGIVTAASTHLIVKMVSAAGHRLAGAAGHLGRVAYNSPVVERIKALAAGGPGPAEKMDRRGHARTA